MNTERPPVLLTVAMGLSTGSWATGVWYPCGLVDDANAEAVGRALEAITIRRVKKPKGVGYIDRAYYANTAVHGLLEASKPVWSGDPDALDFAGMIALVLPSASTILQMAPPRLADCRVVLVPARPDAVSEAVGVSDEVLQWYLSENFRAYSIRRKPKLTWRAVGGRCPDKLPELLPQTFAEVASAFEPLHAFAAASILYPTGTI